MAIIPSYMSPKILLADDHSMITKGVRLLCELHMGLTEVREVTSCKDLLHELETARYTHLVLDINLSDGSSIDILPSIKKNHPNLHIAVLTVHGDNIYYNALKQYGIQHFINKSAKAEDTVTILGRFFRNDIPARNKPTPAETPNPFAAIAPRELQILHYWLQGTNTKEMARLLGVTMSTISTVKAKILEKTNTNNFVELNELAKLYKIIK
jgi:two-component system invasion response regulator UvrY